MDDFDVFQKRIFGSGDKKPRPHKRALLFVDNSGADVVLGMLPLARELLRRGTEVSSLTFIGEAVNHLVGGLVHLPLFSISLSGLFILYEII